MDTNTIVSEIKGMLQNLPFPARKKEVVEHAQAQGASESTLDTLKRLPEEKFDSIQDLLGKLPGLGDIEEQIDKFL